MTPISNGSRIALTEGYILLGRPVGHPGGLSSPMVLSNALAMTSPPPGFGSSPNPSVWPARQVMSRRVQACSTAMGICPHADATVVERSVDWKAF